MSTKHQLIMLGTGSAGVTECYNTCFAVKNENRYVLIDAGGGNGILIQLKKAGINISEINDMCITHAHTDNLLGAIWVIRTVANEYIEGRNHSGLNVVGNSKVIDVIRWICENTLPPRIRSYIGKEIKFISIEDGGTFEAAGMKCEAFDIGSKKEIQYGVKIFLPDGKTLVSLGDEPYTDISRHYVEHCDWLLCEAFCLYRDREIFKPYEKHHSTALDAGRLAAELNVSNLLLFHTEDKTLKNRKETYTEEAGQYFTGNIYVPYDLERFEL